MQNKQTKASRRQRKQKRQGAGIVGLTKVVTGFPDRFRVTMVYGGYNIYAPAAGTFAAQSYRGNSVYDPDFTGAGSTAQTYTQCAALYNRYRVLSSKLVLDVYNQGTVPVLTVVGASISNSLPATDKTLGLRHQAQGTVCPGGPQEWKHTASVATHSIFGVPKQQVLSEDDFAGLIGANPNNVWYWHIKMLNLNGAVAGSVLATVRIEYEVVWSMPLDLAP